MKSLTKQWQESLEKKEKKVKKKDLVKHLAKYIRKQDKWADGDVVLLATNYSGSPVTIKCHTLAECYENLAILNGFTIN